MHSVKRQLDGVNVWCLSPWAFGSSSTAQFRVALDFSLVQHHRGDRTHGKEMLSVYQILSQLPRLIEIGFPFIWVMVQIYAWDQELSRSYLKHLFGALLRIA